MGGEPDERVCCHSGKAAARHRPRVSAEPEGRLLQRLLLWLRSAQQAELCAAGLPGGGCSPSDPRAHPPLSFCPQTSPN